LGETDSSRSGEANSGGWEFSIFQEERHSQLNAETPSENTATKDVKEKPWIIFSVRRRSTASCREWLKGVARILIAGYHQKS